MKRWLVALALLCVAIPASAFWQSRGSNYNQSITAPAGGNVTVDVVGTQAFQANSSAFNYTGLTITGGLTQPGLVCVWERAHVSNLVFTGAAMTWNGVSMTQLGTAGAFGDTRGVLIFGLRNPASGNQTLAVSATNAASDNMINCVSFSNVNQSSDGAAFPNFIASNVVTTVNVTSAAGHIAVGAFASSLNISGILGTQVLLDNANGTIIGAGADYVVSSGASTTVGSGTAANAGIAGVDVSN